jgi:two-component system chemotaxis response regulator CheB
MNHRIQVLIVDDSSLVRRTLTDVLSSDPELEVMGAAGDPFDAAAIMRHRAPDVIILDIQMPRMDGLTFLQRLMTQYPIPTIICSFLAAENSPAALSAIELGAIDVITKPNVSTKQFLEEAKIRICDAVKAAARSRVVGKASVRPDRLLLDMPAPDPAWTERAARVSVRPGVADKVIVVGASTGGIDAVSRLLQALPANAPGIAVVQHLPAGFTAAFAASLNRDCKISVREARTGDAIERGRALIAPGDHHMIMKRHGAQYQVEVHNGPLVNRHRPSVDVLFTSAAESVGPRALGVLLTGMGEDGSRGLLKLREAGAHTIAQDEATSVVYGMPAAAVRLGAAAEVLPLDSIAAALQRRASS